MAKPHLAIVILNWNGRKYLEKFLPHVVKYSCKDGEIIVADNASTDDSISFLENNFPKVRIIKMEKNHGYTGGYNIALKQIKADYFVLLNSDILVTEGWIKPIIELMESDSAIAACQPKILDYYKKDTFEYAGAAGGFIDYFGYPFCRGRIMNHLEKDMGQYDDIAEIFWATGACMFIRAESFHDIGGLDNDFFAHMEEIDLCWRLKRKGKKIFYCGKSTVYHVGGGTLPKNNPRKTFYNFRNNLCLLTKNLSLRKLLFVLLNRALLDGIASFAFLIKGNFGDCLAVYKAWFSFSGKFLSMRKNGKQLPKTKVSGIYNGSIIFAKIILRKKTFRKLKFKLS